MRTTLSIDDDVFTAARALARQQRTSIGEVLSDLARRALRASATSRSKDGLPQLPISNPDAVVTLEIVNSLRDEAP